MNWYLLQTKPNAQTMACKHLKQQGFEVFLPLMIKTYKRAGKFLDRKVPLFPSYLFLGSELREIPWKSINATRGVKNAVSLDGHYRPLNNKIIDGIKCRCDKNNVLMKMDTLTQGDLVKIERGPLSDFVCSVEKISDDRRVLLLIESLNKKTRAEVAYRDLSKVS